MEAKEEAKISLLNHNRHNEEIITQKNNIPEDSLNAAYIIYFILGTGLVLPWNAFITAVDYFHYLYPDHSINRIFAVVYYSFTLVFLLIIFCFRKFNAYVRINLGLGLFLLALLVVPLIDLFYIKGRSGLYYGCYVTVGALGLTGVANALAAGGVIGSAAELPHRYMQAVQTGISASGFLVSCMRIFTKAVYPQDIHGLRNSAILYFIVAILFVVICIFLYNVVSRLPVIKHHNKLRTHAVSLDKHDQDADCSLFTSSTWEIMHKIKWYGFGVIFINIVTRSIFPGLVTEDVHSIILGDWYAILLITCFNVFDFVGKSLTALYLLDNANIAVGACIARLLFFPLYLGCLDGPQFFRTEIPVIGLTSLLGLTNGYFSSVVMILAPKTVQLQHAETAGILILVFVIFGMAVGSVLSWFWLI